jgi:hypothetical protein
MQEMCLKRLLKCVISTKKFQTCFFLSKIISTLTKMSINYNPHFLLLQDNSSAVARKLAQMKILHLYHKGTEALTEDSEQESLHREAMGNLWFVFVSKTVTAGVVWFLLRLEWAKHMQHGIQFKSRNPGFNGFHSICRMRQKTIFVKQLNLTISVYYVCWPSS